MITRIKGENLYPHVELALKVYADSRGAELDKRFHKYDEFHSYGLTASKFHEVFRRFKPSFKGLPLSDRLRLAERLFASGMSEQAAMANGILALSVKELTPAHLPLIDRFLDDFHSWSTTDDFCVNVLQPLFLHYPKEVLKLLKKWNKSPNRWKRRASVVAFVRKVGASGNYTDEALMLCEALIWDKEDLVQKGVGWALKDMMRGDKAKVLAYVKGLRRRGVSAVITLYAIRNLKGRERKTVLAIRPTG